MDSKYVKELDEEIRNIQKENEIQFNLANINKNENFDKKKKSNLEKDEAKEKLEEENEYENIENENNYEEEENEDLVNEEINSIALDIKNNENNMKSLKEEKKNNNNKEEIDEPKINSNFPDIMSMNSFNVCQCCNKEFDSNNNMPYVLKCNHFFCKNCLENYFTDEEGIKCPMDGLVGKSMNDIKILTTTEKYDKESNNISQTKNHLSSSNNTEQKNINKNKEKKYKKRKNKLNENDIQNENKYLKGSNNSSNKQKTESSKRSLKNYLYQKNELQNQIEDRDIINNSISNNIINDNLSKNEINRNEEMENNENEVEVEEEENNQNYCNLHPEQKITHFVEETKELICIHCAFNKLKNNPSIQIKEISEKNRNNFLIKIEEIYQENSRNMNNKLDNFTEIIDIAEKLKEDFFSISEQAPYEFNHLTQAFNKFVREMNDKSKSDLDIIQYNFSHDDLNKVLKYLNNFSDVKTRKKCFRFDLLKNNSNQNFAIKELKSSTNSSFNNNFNKSMLDSSNDNARFNFRLEENSTQFNRFNMNCDNCNGNSVKESINSALNKYIIPKKNNINDNLYKKNQFENMKNAQNNSNDFINNNNNQNNEGYRGNDKLSILNKYKIPKKK